MTDDIADIVEAVERERRRETELLNQTAERIGTPLIGKLAEDLDLDDEQAQLIADGLVIAAAAGWRLGIQSPFCEIEGRMSHAG
jgi:hypothetical protein